MKEPIKLTSRDNAAVKHARAVRDGRDAGYIFIEGLRLCEEAAASSLVITDAFYTTQFAGEERHGRLRRSVADRAENSYEITDAVSDSLSDTKSPQGIFLIAERPQNGIEKIEKNLAAGASPVLMLHDVNNPANLGAVVRSAEAAGAAGIIVSGRSADIYSAKALRASMGSAFRLPVAEIETAAEALQWAASRGLATVACDVGGTDAYHAFDWSNPAMVVFGSEAHGLDEKILAAIDRKIVIEMNEPVESLNLAVAAGIVMFEARRRRSNS